MRLSRLTALTTLISLVLAGACSDKVSNSDNNNGQQPGAALPSEDVSRISIVTSKTDTFAQGSTAAPITSLTARFYQSDGAQAAPLPDREPPLGCTIRTGSETVSNDVAIASDPLNDIDSVAAFRTVSAGEELSIIGPNGSGGELLPVTDAGDIRYASEPAEGEIEKGTYLSAPGDEIQALPALYLPTTETVRKLSASDIQDGGLTETSRIKWTSRERVGSVARVSMQSVSNASDSAVTVDCMVADSGSFTFPGDVRAIMADTGFDASSLRLSRERYSVERLGEQLILMRATSTGSL